MVLVSSNSVFKLATYNIDIERMEKSTLLREHEFLPLKDALKGMYTDGAESTPSDAKVMFRKGEEWNPHFPLKTFLRCLTTVVSRDNLEARSASPQQLTNK